MDYRETITLRDQAPQVRTTDPVTHSLSVVMPAYNEENNLVSAVILTQKALKSLGLRWEIIIVDDGSSDDTGKIGDELARCNADISCIHNFENSGIGGAFRAGLKSCQMDYVMLIPADNPLSVNELKAYLARFGTCDIVVGARRMRVGYTPFMKFYSFMYNRVLIPSLFHVGISDVNWIPVYRKNIFKKEGMTIEYSGVFFFAEILIKARHKGLRIAEIPVQMKKRTHGKPTSAHFRVIGRTFGDMLRFFLKFYRGKAKHQQK